MEEPFYFGVIGLFSGYLIYLMIDLFSRGSIDSSFGRFITLSTGVIFFFIGRSYYSKGAIE